MSDPSNPSPRRKGKAGLVIGVIVALMAVAIFVGLNLSHSQNAEQPISQQGPGQGG